MRRAPINLNHTLRTPHPPLRPHQHTIIQQRILTPTRKQRRRQLHASQILPKRTDGRIAALGFRGVGEQGVDVGFHHVVVDYEVGFVVQDVGEEGGHVVAAEVEEEAAEGEGWEGL